MSIFCFAIVNRDLDPRSSVMKKSNIDKKKQPLLVLNFFHEDAKKRAHFLFRIRPQTSCVKTKRDLEYARNANDVSKHFKCLFT
jgi:hypothetical protein